ncbi:hypothetical protein HZB08_01375 [Candidatus Saganbacteria bacterium]|uniref:Trigger factor n=1 Tax=Candidatus Saganbacteria bacterium TaxID=2575572 RepID=A0A9D6ULZ8_UNCSA|nr:hypothetical protein [Candidatus Saganbacteria bacterium]
MLKIRSQKREGNQVLLEIEEEFSRFEETVEKVLVKRGAEVRLPGFRPGKAPRQMVEKAVSREALEHRAAQDLISDLYPKIIDETGLEPVAFPDVEVLQQEKDKPFVFKLSVEVYPLVKLGKYKGLKVDRKSDAVTEEEVLGILGKLQKQFTPADLDDEFARKISRYGTLAELKEEILISLRKDKSAEAEADLKNKLIAGACAEAKVDIPPAMVEREIDLMLDELKASLAQSNLTIEDYLRGAGKEKQALRDEMRKAAEIRVKGKVVLRAVGETEKIKITPEDIKSAFPDVKVEEANKKYVEDYLLRMKALDFLVEKAEIRMGEART